MDLRAIANQGSSQINPNIVVTLLRSTGYAVGTGRKQEPSYANPEDGLGQIQALDSIDLKQLDGLNIQGTVRAIYIRGPLVGVNRPEIKGGDLVQFNDQTWLVVKPLESWPSWTKAAIQLQGGT